ncbi:hypothetical protein N1851_029217 [Merluccius polli]|uniref:Reverse transcriptase domain-containing protein n=1 Tax=Merluccius polli TaxID=89951 RepID=A0AA47NRV3_MERPO|nr:hypothetical protein N1851_029217 [Merluccius polli]
MFVTSGRKWVLRCYTLFSQCLTSIQTTREFGDGPGRAGGESSPGVNWADELLVSHSHPPLGDSYRRLWAGIYQQPTSEAPDWPRPRAEAQARNTAFRSGDAQAYSTARADLKRGIKLAKHCYKLKVEEHFSNSNPRRMWQGIRVINLDAIINFADDTTVIGHIKNNEEVDRLAVWCEDNNLLLNTSKTKELIVDFRRNAVTHLPIHINGMTV